MRALLAERKRGSDPGGSDRGRWVADVLEAAGLPRPIPRFRVCVGSRIHELDHAYPELLVAVEFDGWDIHGTYTALHDDRKRWRGSRGRGWLIAVVTSHTPAADLVRDVVAFRELAMRRPA